jgi:hypothetical protein
MKTYCVVLGAASLAVASHAFMVGNPLYAAPKAAACSSTTCMAVTLPALPCECMYGAAEREYQRGIALVLVLEQNYMIQ